ncbi:putative polysaccharide biosynthesis protein [Apilactobacillus timberlakei]|uniref:putative polysaccharide biosynthesis protein n=1 Tax=Apilactobacillus timberlakei TaxID=2008380 RepID=UPI00112D3B68|nr:polysaccharide biosynthesis protein [Apilactobacillus timberlakei]TPR16925.1 polysaccharide biosynthesis protein [Apilactobacillus timberlakei]
MQEQNENNINSDQETQNKMLQGSAWMTAGSILSRILGAIYIIPWSIWFGNLYFQANALYVQGYNIYSMFLIISIAGIPSAIAKEVAHYNSLNEYGISLRLYKRGLVLSFTTGILCALALYFGAPLLDNGNPNVIPVIRSLSWAVLIIPTMSLTRGYFQGFQDMAPSAISQFAEQLFRVIYMLVTAFFIMRVIHGNWTTAVTQSTFAAFIGSLAGLIILGIYYLKRRKYYSHLIENSNNEIHVNANHLYKEIISQAVPFIILGAGISIFQLIDQYTFFDVMKISTNYSVDVLNNLYALFAGNSNKLIMITVSLSSAMAITVVPLLSESFTKKDKNGISNQLSSGFVLFSFVMLPAALGMTAVAGPLNRVFNGTGYNHLAANVLAFSSVISILLGLFTVISAMMQGISQNKLAVKYFIYGTIAKILAQVPMILIFGTFGPLISSAIGFLVANGLIIKSLDNQFGFRSYQMLEKLNFILIFSLVTYLVALATVYLGNTVVGIFTNSYSRVGSFIVVALAVIVGGFIYSYLSLKSRIADYVIGHQSDKLRKILHIK